MSNGVKIEYRPYEKNKSAPTRSGSRSGTGCGEGAGPGVGTINSGVNVECSPRARRADDPLPTYGTPERVRGEMAICNTCGRRTPNSNSHTVNVNNSPALESGYLLDSPRNLREGNAYHLLSAPDMEHSPLRPARTDRQDRDRDRERDARESKEKEREERNIRERDQKRCGDKEMDFRDIRDRERQLRDNRDKGKDTCKELERDSAFTNFRDLPMHVHVNPFTESETGSSGVLSSEICDLVRKLQRDIETIRDSIDIYDKDSSIRVYERIDHCKVSHRPKASFMSRLAAKAKQSGYHRLQIIVSSDEPICKRIFWLLLLLAVLGLLSLQLWDRVYLFLTNSSFTNIDARPVDSLLFPAVTICNLNMYRLTKLAEAGLYTAVQRALDTGDAGNLSDINQRHTLSYLNAPYMDFIRNMTHQKPDFIRRCIFRGRHCGHWNFTETLTDQGLCFTYVAPKDIRTTLSAGPSSGLSLVLNTEQYEYVLTSRSAVGVKVAIHDPEEIPDMPVQGQNVPVGSHTFMTISKKYSVNPYANHCQDWNGNIHPPVNRSECQRACESRLIASYCNCRMENAMLRGKPKRMCTTRDYLVCIRKLAGRFPGENPCKCSDECYRVAYTSFISEAGSSVYAAESHIRALYSERPTLERKFQVARDLRQRADQSIFEHDSATLGQIAEQLNVSASKVLNVSKNLEQFYNSYKESLKKIRMKLKSLNSTVQMHYHAFQKSSHALFYRLLDHLNKTMSDILEKENVLKYVKNRDHAKVKEKIDQIAGDLDRLAVSKEFNLFNPSALLLEIAKGVTRFREDLVLESGYGQNYREFKDEYQFYNQHTMEILNLTSRITEQLKRNYVLIRNASQLLFNPIDRTSAKRLERMLTLFFSSLKSLATGRIRQLQSDVKIIIEAYTNHRHKILELYDQMSNILASFLPEQATLTGLFGSIEKSLKSLKTDFDVIAEESLELKQLYLKKGIEKSDLARRFQGNNLTGEIDRTEDSLERLQSLVASLNEKANVTGHSLTPLLPRLIDFNLLLPGDVPQLFYSLRFDQTTVTLQNAVKLLERSLRGLIIFQTELQDYAKGSRINARFYQNNFLQLNIYFRDMSEIVVLHRTSYSLTDLACDIGGSLALYFGASILTIFGLMDILLRSIFSSSSSSATAN